MTGRIAIAALLLALTACAATLRVDSDFDPAASFAGYRSFAWIREDPLIQSSASPTSISPLNSRRIRDAVESALQAKGYTLNPDRTAADFVVAFTVGARDRLDATSYPAPFYWGGYWGHAYFGSAVEVRSYREGQLSIDIFDGKSHQPVWHGGATKRITESDRKNAQSQIDAAVKAILARFPPGAATKS
jgi:hypothetical protein